MSFSRPEADVRRGEWVDPRLARVTFGERAADYLTTIVHLRTITRRDYERILNRHILPAFEKRPLAMMPIDIRRLMAEKQAAGQAAKSLQKIRLVLRQVLELARASGATKRAIHATVSGCRGQSRWSPPSYPPIRSKP
jgi:hypothetical protein